MEVRGPRFQTSPAPTISALETQRRRDRLTVSGLKSTTQHRHFSWHTTANACERTHPPTHFSATRHACILHSNAGPARLPHFYARSVPCPGPLGGPPHGPKAHASFRSLSLLQVLTLKCACLVLRLAERGASLNRSSSARYPSSPACCLWRRMSPPARPRRVRPSRDRRARPPPSPASRP